MTSLLCVKSTAGTVRVHCEEEDLNKLAVDENETTSKFMPRPSSKKKIRRPNTVPSTSGGGSSYSMETTSAILQQVAAHSQRGWLSKKQLQELQEQSVKVFDWVYSPWLQTEHTFVKDVKDYLDRQDMLDLRKRELLHKNWNSRVYEPIREKIVGAMTDDDWPDKDRRRRELHRQYLEHVNKKGHVFLDTLDAGEYYAQALNQHRPTSIMVHTENLQDPLLSQERERNREDQVVLRCTTGEHYSQADVHQVRLPPLPLVPLGRHGTDSGTWLEMPLANIESTPRKASRQRMRGNCTETQIDLPGWSKMQFDAKVLDHEMQLQKRRMFEEKPPYGIPARQFARASFATKTTCSEQNALVAVNT